MNLDDTREEAVNEIVADLTGRLGLGLKRQGLNDPQLKAIGAVALAEVVRAYCKASGHVYAMRESIIDLIRRGGVPD